MNAIKYYKNQVIKNLLFIKEVEGITLKDGRNRRRALFRCKCGKEFMTSLDNARKGQKSCGCIKGKHFATHKMSSTRIYRQWRSMKERCSLLNDKSFVNYGGRGITVCDEWKNDFTTYFEWAMVNGYEDHLTIDRIDNDGNYEPSNCRFSTKCIQARNTRKLMITNTSGYRGVSKSSGQWMVRITVNKERLMLGRFNNKIDAAKAYDKYVIDNNLEHTKNFE